MNVVSILRFAARRLRSRLALNLLCLLGVVFAVGLVSGIPIFAQGVSFLVLREELAQIGRTLRHAPFAVRFQYLASEDRPLPSSGSREVAQLIYDSLARRLGLPIRHAYHQVDSPTLGIRSVPSDLRFGGQGGVELRRINLAATDGMGERIIVTDGLPYGTPGTGDRLHVWVHARLLNDTGLNPGEPIDLVHHHSGRVFPALIAGIWQARNVQDLFWYYDPDTTWRDYLIITPEDYERAVEPLLPQRTGYSYWYYIMDEGAMAPERAALYAGALEAITNELSTRLRGISLDRSPLDPLRRYVRRKETLSLFLTSFSLPAFGLILYFFSSLSMVVALFQREETAILSSRGAQRAFMVAISCLETALLVLVGLPIGLALGSALAWVMGFSRSFMVFAEGPAITVSPWGQDWLLLGGAAFLLFVARLIPTLRAAGAGVVVHLRERSRHRIPTDLWKVAVDVPLLVATAYGYWSLSRRGMRDIVNVDPLGDPFRDPLLLLAPSLFVFTVSLVAAHLFPLLMRPLDRLSSVLGHFSIYMGLRQLARQGRQYSSALFLIIVCLSLGAFYASTALSLDRWLLDRIYYQVGADLRFSQGAGGGGGPDGGGVLTGPGGWLLPPSDYLELPGITGATRVGRYEVSPQLEGVRRMGHFMGVDRLDFGEVAFFRADLAPAPLGELMNRLGMHEDGLLVSRRLMRATRLVEGQPVTLAVHIGSAAVSVDFRIVGTYDYFPTVYSHEREVVVGNLEYLFEQVGGIQPHEIWLRTTEDADTYEILDGITGKGVAISNVEDAAPLLQEDQERQERVGLFGVLSIGFLAGAILSCIGLLVYTYASLEGRLQQFSILRAIGAQVRDVLVMVASEYAGVVVYGLLVGVGVGIAASHLYVPFFQITGEGARAVPPFVPLIAWTQIAWIGAAFAATLIASQVIILLGVSRRNLSILLRMGQRE